MSLTVDVKPPSPASSASRKRVVSPVSSTPRITGRSGCGSIPGPGPAGIPGATMFGWPAPATRGDRCGEDVGLLRRDPAVLDRIRGHVAGGVYAVESSYGAELGDRDEA